MEYNYIEKRYNIINLSSIEAFASIKGGINGNCKDVYFIRMIGVNHTFEKDITKMDRIQTEKMLHQQGIYNRIAAFPKNIEMDEAKIYMDCYEKWHQSGRIRLFTKKLNNQSGIEEVISISCKKVLEIYKRFHSHLNDSIEKNFVVKLLFWLDTLAFDYLKNWNPKQSMKFVAQQVIKEQEYLFCYFLTLLGIDVLLLQNEKDIDEKMDHFRLSEKFILGEKKPVILENYNKQNDIIQKNQNSPFETANSTKVETQNLQRPKISISAVRKEQIKKEESLKQESTERTSPERRTPSARESTQATMVSHNRELDFEELALKASSVVMIAIHDRQGDVIGSGSGIMIGRDGYILTNYHVASGGVFYSIRIENDNTTYKTDEIIKYNSLLDLAVIRIQRKLQPLPIYNGRKLLVRGQKVVAIGSPLGLFNSVSDGIISGFRTINDVDMIQFTAPISHGSSGGAVLNMYGEVIGVSTAGFDDGQNINLAVGYQFINTFIKGFQ